MATERRYGFEDHLLCKGPQDRTPSAAQRRLTVQTQNSYVYDADRVQALYALLQPDEELYGDDPAYAVFQMLQDSLLGADVFEEQGDYNHWPEKDEAYDPEA